MKRLFHRILGGTKGTDDLTTHGKWAEWYTTVYAGTKGFLGFGVSCGELWGIKAFPFHIKGTEAWMPFVPGGINLETVEIGTFPFCVDVLPCDEVEVEGEALNENPDDDDGEDEGEATEATTCLVAVELSDVTEDTITLPCDCNG